MGDALVLVPRDVCVASATIGMGGVDVFDNDSGGVDVDFEDRQTALPGGRRVVVDADVGLGAFEVQHERRDRWDERRRRAGEERGAARVRPDLPSLVGGLALGGLGCRSCSTRRTRSTSASRPSPPSPSRRWGRSSSRGAEPPDVA